MTSVSVKGWSWLLVLAFGTVGCQSQPAPQVAGCGPRAPTLAADVLHLSPTDGDIVQKHAIPWFVEARRVGSSLKVTSPVGKPEAVVSEIDRRPEPVAEVRNEGSALVGAGWTLPGAAGRLLGVVDGVLVVAGDDRQVRGIRLRDGHLVWNARKRYVIATQVAELSGRVVYGVAQYRGGVAGGDRVFALDAVRGRLLWRKPLGNSHFSQAVLVTDGGLVVARGTDLLRNSEGPDSGQVIRYDLATGDVVWTSRLQRGIVPTVDTRLGELVVTNIDRVKPCRA
jgi:hypothetical protein